MGYHKEVIEVLPGSVRSESANRFTSTTSNSLAARIVRTALSEWRTGDYDRNASPDIDEIKLLSAAPIELGSTVIDEAENRQSVGNGYYRHNNLTTILPVMDTRDYKVRKKTITVTLNNEEWLRYRNGYPILNKVREMLPEIAPTISSCRVLMEDGAPNNGTAGWKVNSVVDVDTSGGKAKTVYYLKVDGRDYPNTTFDTIASARAKGAKLFEANLKISSVEVVGTVRREDNSAMVTMKREVRSASAKVEVSYVKITNPKPRFTSYLVSFWCHT
ncbi:MAG: hypothetical protein H9W81_07975 [Enterococcus sp.]|nr:hypothetical protein [Enterococcus sp.]